MDLEEWELLPDHGFLQIHDDGGRKIFSRKYGSPDAERDFNMNYFICPSPMSQKAADSPEKVPVPIRLEQSSRVPTDHGPVEPDEDTVSQVFFNKMKENEFVDMKMDSPKSSIGSKMKIEKETVVSKKNRIDLPAEESGGEEKGGGRNLWKWSLTGIGAICSFGVAAATICVIVLGSHRRNKQQCQQNQNLRLQIYADEKSIKEVVHHTTKLSQRCAPYESSHHSWRLL